MREERKTKVLSKMEWLYGRGRYLGGIREFKECNGPSERI